MGPRTKVFRRLLAASALCLVVLVSAAIPASAAFVPPYNPTFPDVPTDHPFYLEIEWLAAEGITTGYADGLFRPASPVTRLATRIIFHLGLRAAALTMWPQMGNLAA